MLGLQVLTVNNKEGWEGNGFIRRRLSPDLL
jgi:hypothetical protein